MERSVETCSLEMTLLQNANANDKVFIIADTRHNQRWSERKVDPMLCKGDLAFFFDCPVTLEDLRLWAQERTPGIPRNVGDLETVEFADVLGAIAEDQHLTRCARVCFTGTEEDQAPGTIDEVREIKTWNKEEMPCKKPIEKLTFLNRCRYPVTQTPRKNVWHPGFVFVAELASLSDDYIETCDIYRKKHSCKCYVLPELHKITPVPPRRSDAKDATTQSQDLKHTECLHLDFTLSLTKWESMCSRSSIKLVCASQS